MRSTEFIIIITFLIVLCQCIKDIESGPRAARLSSRHRRPIRPDFSFCRRRRRNRPSPRRRDSDFARASGSGTRRRRTRDVRILYNFFPPLSHSLFLSSLCLSLSLFLFLSLSLFLFLYLSSSVSL